MTSNKRSSPGASEVTGNRCPVSRDLAPKSEPVDNLRPLGRETRRHSASQLRKLAKSLERFGFVLPVLIDAEGRVVAGWGLVLAARRLELRHVPAVRLTDLSQAELRMLRLALNRLSEDGAWDPAALALEFTDIVEIAPQSELEFTGFEAGEIDSLLSDNGLDQEDEVPPIETGTRPVSQPGDLWHLGEHRLYCGNALEPDSFARVLGADHAQAMFADPPYNRRAEQISGLGKAKHADFAMAAGEQSVAEFTSFLAKSLGLAAGYSADGAVHFVCMDWRHQREMLDAGEQVYSGLLNLCTWVKSNAGMGSLYRSQHELIYVFKVGKSPHINNVQLGTHGRHRTNVWNYVSQSALSGTSKGKVGLHPTVKPVGLIADAIRDCSNRGGIVLDPFGGAGTTLIAAEQTGRRARLIELEPQFVDVTIERWQRLTGQIARHAGTGLPFSRTPNTAPATGKE